MEKNVGNIDKVIRVVIALVFVWVAYTYSWWWLILTVGILGSAITGYCPPYKLFKINTAKKKEEVKV